MSINVGFVSSIQSPRDDPARTQITQISRGLERNTASSPDS